MTYEARAADLVGVPVFFAHVDPSALRGLGVAVTGLVDGALQYSPSLIAGKAGASGDPLTFGGGEGALDALGGSEEEGEGEAIGEWLEIDVLVPDAPPRRIVREIFDRVGVDRRATGDVDLSALPPMELTETAAGQVFVPLTMVSVISVVGYQTPASYFQQDYGLDDFEGDLAVAAHGYHAVRDALQVEIATDRGYRWYHDQPNLTAATVVPVGLTVDGGALEGTLDVLHQGYGVVPLKGASGATHPRVVAGVLAHVAERLAAAGATAPGEAPSGRSVGRVFEEAARVGVEVRTIRSTDADLAELDVSDVAKARISEALAADYAVIVPERAVEIDGEQVVGWWQVDPATGVTFDLMENGQGAQDLPEDATVLIPRVIAAQQYRAMAIEAVAVGFMVGIAIWAFIVIVTN